MHLLNFLVDLVSLLCLMICAVVGFDLKLVGDEDYNHLLTAKSESTQSLRFQLTLRSATRPLENLVIKRLDYNHVFELTLKRYASPGPIFVLF